MSKELNDKCCTNLYSHLIYDHNGFINSFFSCFFLHHRATIQAVSAFLDAFQKIADAATSAKGKKKENTKLAPCLVHYNYACESQNWGSNPHNPVQLNSSAEKMRLMKKGRKVW